MLLSTFCDTDLIHTLFFFFFFVFFFEVGGGGGVEASSCGKRL